MSANDSELLEICARLQMIDSEYVTFDRFGRGSAEEVNRIGDMRDNLVDQLAAIQPVTPEGARAQAMALLPLLRDHDNGCVNEGLVQLIQRVVAGAAGRPDLGGPLEPWKTGIAFGPRFHLALKVLAQ
jgi:VIT1/CCC1 family predicted Fe2+/Mn2+ transporter